MADKMKALEGMRTELKRINDEMNKLKSAIEQNKQYDAEIRANIEYRNRSKALVEHNHTVKRQTHSLIAYAQLALSSPRLLHLLCAYVVVLTCDLSLFIWYGANLCE